MAEDINSDGRYCVGSEMLFGPMGAHDDMCQGPVRNVWLRQELPFTLEGGVDWSRRAFAKRWSARHSPATDSWTPTTLVNAPRNRYGHTAVWTGSEVITFGADTYSYGIYVFQLNACLCNNRFNVVIDN